MTETAEEQLRGGVSLGAPADTLPLAAWFLGPRAENANNWQELLTYIFQDYVHWRRNYFPTDPVVVGRVRRRSPAHEAWLDNLASLLDSTLSELKHHFPFYSPRYNAHMLSEQTLPALLGYFAGMLYNPNNVTDEAAPITVALEIEVGKMVSAMLGYNPQRSWAHLCSGGTIANLEALWVARAVQMLPFSVREFCSQRGHQFPIKMSNGEWRPITEVADRELISLRPNESIFMLRKLARFLSSGALADRRAVLDEINAHLRVSAFNPARRGVAEVLKRVGLRPKLFVSAAAHYSFAKAVNVLGYGEDCIELVPTNSRFQIDLRELESRLFSLPASEYVAAVVGIVGTTEEGAVDAVHHIRFLRDRLEKEQNRSFWLHLDAAWGGYMRSLFVNGHARHLSRGTSLEQICDEYVRALGIEERFTIDFGTDQRRMRQMTLRWAEKEIYASFLAIPDADSVTVDPHKMGYVPYPAGIVAYRNGLVTDLVAQRAQYISDVEGGLKSIDEPVRVDAVGPYILEGSKAGATALSCWLAHKSIPLSADGHGKIVRTTLLSAKRLFKYIVNHRHLFRRFQLETTGDEECLRPFTFVPFSEPDTNIICFMATPMGWQNGELVSIDCPLRWKNRLNEKIYTAASLTGREGRRRGSAAQPFFVSRTRFEESQYSADSIKDVLARNYIGLDEYRRHGIFVLRSVVMNPWHGEAEAAGMDYLLEFIKFLHGVAAIAVEEMYKESGEELRRRRSAEAALSIS
jgi:glutamate/tyrosine decarboxylase-like PLP-dependent enzyme